MAPKRPSKGVRQPTPDEDALWRHVVRDTQPLHRSAKSRHSALQSKTSPIKARSKGGTPAPRQALRTPHELKQSPTTVGLGLDKRSAQRLKRGRTSIEGRLDLHGMTMDQAHGALDQFIDRALRAGKRCVLVITGKGQRANSDDPEWGDADYRGPRGVLRDAVPKWLQIGARRNQILAIEPARPQHGGDGAYYVLLRRKRP